MRPAGNSYVAARPKEDKIIIWMNIMCTFERVVGVVRGSKKVVYHCIIYYMAYIHFVKAKAIRLTCRLNSHFVLLSTYCRWNSFSPL